MTGYIRDHFTMPALRPSSSGHLLKRSQIGHATQSIGLWFWLGQLDQTTEAPRRVYDLLLQLVCLLVLSVARAHAYYAFPGS